MKVSFKRRLAGVLAAVMLLSILLPGEIFAAPLAENIEKNEPQVIEAQDTVDESLSDETVVEEAVPIQMNAPVDKSALDGDVTPISTPTIEQFNNAVEFTMGIEGDGRTGSTQTVKVIYVYSGGVANIKADDVSLKLTFPAGVEVDWPSTTKVNYTSEVNGDGSTTVTMSWNDFSLGSGSDSQMFFRVPNGVTPNGSIYNIKAEVYYDGQKSEPNSSDMVYTTLVDSFKWNNISHAPYSGVVILPTGSHAIPTQTISYNTSLLEQKTSGRSFTDKVIIEDKITIGDDVLIKESDITLSQGGVMSDVVTKSFNGSNYVTSFSVKYELQNGDTTQELGYVSPMITFANGQLKDTITATSTVPMFSSQLNDLKAQAYPAVKVSDTLSHITESGGKQYQVLAGNGVNVQVKYTEPVVENPKASETITKSVFYVNGGSSPGYAYAGDVVTYGLYNFKNAQLAPMTSYKVTDVIDRDSVYPNSITTGTYLNYGLLSGYTINVYRDGISLPIAISASFSTNSTINLGDYVGDLRTITKIEYDFGAVPNGFTVSNTPQVRCVVKTQKDDKPYVPITNTARVDYTYKSTDYNKEVKVAQDLTYKKRDPGDYEETSYNKQAKNLTNPAATRPAQGDLIEYTITFKNDTGIKLHSPEIEDRAKGLSPYLSPNMAGYTMNNVKIVSAPSGVGLSSVSIKGGTADPHLFISMTGVIDIGETIKIAYVMKVDGDVDKGDTVINEFDAYGYPEGPGNTRIYIGSGYNKGKGSGPKAMPQVSIAEGVTRKDNGNVLIDANGLHKDEKAVITITVKNDIYGTVTNGGDLDIGSIISSLRKTDAVAYVDGTAKISYLENGVPKTANVTMDTNTQFSTSYMNHRFVMPSESIKIAAGDSLVLTYEVVAVRDGNVSAAPGSQVKSESFLGYSYAFFNMTTGEYLSPTGKGDDSTTNIDKIASTKSYISTNTSLYLKRPDKLYGGIETSVVPTNIDLSSSNLTRTYWFKVHNYSDEGNLDLNTIVSKIPLYESYVSGSAQMAYNTTSGLSPISATESKELNTGNKILSFSPSSSVSVEPSKYVYITFKTEFAGDNLKAAIAKGQSWSELDGFIPAVSLKDSKEMESYVAAHKITKVDDTAADWDSNGNTAFLYQAVPKSVSNYYNNFITPGVAITPKKIVKTSTTETYKDIESGDTLIPTNDLGWNIMVRNTSSRKEMVNPIVSVVLPYGMTFVEFEGGSQPSEIKDYQITTVNSQQVITFEMNKTFAYDTSYSFNIKTDPIKCSYGEQLATIYLAPNQLEIFYGVANGTKTEAKLKDITGISGAGYENTWNMVTNTGKVSFFGTFAFSSNISITGEAKTASDEGTIDVSRSIDTFGYTLTFGNDSVDKSYKDLTLINRLPGVDDVSSTTPVTRGSTMDVKIESIPKVYLNGILQNPIIDYVIDYGVVPADQVIDPGEYGIKGTASINWNASYDEATVFRVKMLKEIPVGGKVVVKYDAAFVGDIADYPEKDALANNSFGFAFRAKTGMYSAETEVISESAKVGLRLPNQYFTKVSGKLFIDKNNNGVKDSGEEFYEVPLQMDLESSTDSSQNSTMNTASGSYEFSQLPEGNYKVSFKVPDKYKLSEVYPVTGGIVHSFLEGTDDGYVAFIAPDNEDKEFVFHAGLVPTAGRISGRIFIDNDEDGIYDPSVDELYDEAVPVRLVSGGSTLTGVTDVATGLYDFDNVAFGTYKVEADVPDGYTKTSGSTDFIGETDMIVTADLELSVDHTDYVRNAGISLIRNNGIVSGVLFEDLTNTYSYDAAEDKIITKATKVELVDAATDNVVKTLTTSNGYYEFTNVDHGDYKVQLSGLEERSVVAQTMDTDAGNKFKADCCSLVLTVAPGKIHAYGNAGFEPEKTVPVVTPPSEKNEGSKSTTGAKSSRFKLPKTGGDYMSFVLLGSGLAALLLSKKRKK